MAGVESWLVEEDSPKKGVETIYRATVFPLGSQWRQEGSSWAQEQTTWAAPTNPALGALLGGGHVQEHPEGRGLPE